MATKKKKALSTASSTKVVPTTEKLCKPFSLEVMVFSPEAGYKFKVVVELSCTTDADELWKLVFDLYRVTKDNEIQLVHVSFTTGTPVESKKVQAMASKGVTLPQAKVLIDDVHPAVKAVADKDQATEQDKTDVHNAMAKVLNV